MVYIGHGVVGDSVYSNGKPKWLNGQCLHAREIGFVIREVANTLSLSLIYLSILLLKVLDRICGTEKMFKDYLLVTDLDGTLLDSQKKILLKIKQPLMNLLMVAVFSQ